MGVNTGSHSCPVLDFLKQIIVFITIHVFHNLHEGKQSLAPPLSNSWVRHCMSDPVMNI